MKKSCQIVFRSIQIRSNKMLQNEHFENTHAKDELKVEDPQS